MILIFCEIICGLLLLQKPPTIVMLSKFRPLAKRRIPCGSKRVIHICPLHGLNQKQYNHDKSLVQHYHGIQPKHASHTFPKPKRASRAIRNHVSGLPVKAHPGPWDRPLDTNKLARDRHIPNTAAGTTNINNHYLHGCRHLAKEQQTPLPGGGALHAYGVPANEASQALQKTHPVGASTKETNREWTKQINPHQGYARSNPYYLDEQ